MLVRKFQTWAAAGACLSMLITPVAFAGPQGAVATPSDVALQDGGVLVGQLFDAQGAPLVKAPVRIAMRGHEVARAATDEKGVFKVAGLRGGVHEVATAGHSEVYRLWAPRTAPPAAKSGILLVNGRDAVRGQYGNPGPFARAMGWVAEHPILTGAAIAAAIAIPIAVADDDDAS